MGYMRYRGGRGGGGEVGKSQKEERRRGRKGGGEAKKEEGKKEQKRGGEERKREEGKRERGKRRWGEEKIEEMRWGCAENLTWNLGFTSQVGQRRWGMYPKAAEGRRKKSSMPSIHISTGTLIVAFHEMR